MPGLLYTTGKDASDTFESLVAIAANLLSILWAVQERRPVFTIGLSPKHVHTNYWKWIGNTTLPYLRSKSSCRRRMVNYGEVELVKCDGNRDVRAGGWFIGETI